MNARYLITVTDSKLFTIREPHGVVIACKSSSTEQEHRAALADFRRTYRADRFTIVATGAA